MASFAEFDKQLDRATVEAVGQVVEFHKAISQRVFQMLVTDTRTSGFSFGSPVWSGRYRRSMTIAVNRVDTSSFPANPDAFLVDWPEEPGRKYPAPPASEVRNKLQGLKIGDVVYIANSVPYVRRIENGHSKKAPAGVFAVTAAAAEPMLQNEADTLAYVIRR